MALIIKEIRLEVSKPNLIQAIVAKQHDCNSRFLKVSLWDEGTQIPIRSTAEVTINAERKDGASDSFFGKVNEDNTVTVPLHSWMLELAGDVNCDVSIIVEGRKLTTTSFVVMVEKASNSGDDVSNDPQYDVLVDLISGVNGIEQIAASALRCSATGNPLLLDDVSPLDHEMEVKLSGGSYQKTGSPLLNSTGEDNVYEFHSAGNKYETDTFVRVIVSTEQELEFSDGSYFSTYNEDICQLNSFASEGETVCLCTEDGITYLYKAAKTKTVLQTFGKNLLDMSAWSDLFVPDPDEEGAYISIKNVSTTHQLEVNLPAGVYTISGYVKSPINEDYGTAIYYADGTRQTKLVTSTGEYEFQSTTTNGKPIKKIGFWYRRYGGRVGLKNIQLEIGPTYTAYEPFQGGTYTPDEEGKVTVPSIYPEMKLVAGDGVTITAEYNADTKKYIDKKFNELAAMIAGS